MIKKVECGTDFFGDLLLLGVIDTYSGYLQFDEERFETEDEDFSYDYDDYMEDVDRKLAEFFGGFVFERYFQPLGFKKLTYKRLYQPKYYNYGGDHVEFELDYEFEFRGEFTEFAAKKVENMLNGTDTEGKENFEQFLNDNYKSYDGFASLTPSTLEQLLEDLQDGGDTYRAENAFLAAWVFDRIQAGEIEKIEDTDFIRQVVEQLDL